MGKYISKENEQKINDLLNDENAELIIKTMISKYTKESISNAQDILSYITDIVDNILKITSKQIQDSTQASWMLIFQKEMNKEDVHTYFATMVPVCKTMFPDGYPENGNLAQKTYFNEFVNLCRKKKAFSWDNPSDVSWAKNFDYMDYLEMIWEKYIDNKEN